MHDSIFYKFSEQVFVLPLALPDKLICISGDGNVSGTQIRPRELDGKPSVWGEKWTLPVEVFEMWELVYVAVLSVTLADKWNQMESLMIMLQ